MATDELHLLRAGLSGQYSVKKQIGRGGAAYVYLAHDPRHDRLVAIKVLLKDVAAAVGAERFRREILVAARLVHPAIVPVLDSGECPSEDGLGRLWYSMPYIEGETLRARLTRERQLPVDIAVAIAREIASALEYSHQHGIIHRDVKPENILLQGDRPVLADFGIAHVVEPTSTRRLTQSGVSLGTPQYMSPEQALGERDIDARTDVYALGCVLYESLVGEPPFNGPTAQVIVSRMLSDRPRAIVGIRPEAAKYDRAVMKALARAPEERFATAAAFASALGAEDGKGDAGQEGSARARRQYVIIALLAVVIGIVAIRWLLD